MKKKYIHEIKSKYILDSIFTYIKDDKFKMKLFVYSKLYQKKLDFDIVNYQIEILNKNKFNFCSYLKFSKNNLSQQNFNKQYLISQFTNDISKYNINLNDISTIINYYFGNNNFQKMQENNKAKINSEIEIDIFSPYFEFLSNNKNIFKNFCIIVPLARIKKFSLINDYNSIFERLAEIHSNYNSIILYTKDNDDLDILKNLSINYKKIIKLSTVNLGNQINYNIFFNILFSLSINNTLLYLSLKNNSHQIIKQSIFSNINNFNNLEYLSLNKFRFEGAFRLKIHTLKTLFINSCENITLDEMTGLNLKKLYIYDSNRFFYESTNSLLKLPNVEECELIDRQSEISHYNYLIDFNSFNSLKFLKVEDTDFYSLKDAPVKIATIYNHSFVKRSINIKLEISDLRILRKIISIKSLEKISFRMTIYNKERLLRIKDKNYSIKDIEVFFNDYVVGDFLTYFCNFFPNLTRLSVIIRNIIRKKESGEYILDIVENNNCKINNFKIIMANTDIKLFCGNFENMETIDIECLEKISDIKSIIPLFNNYCNRIFLNLKHFRFVYHDSDGINSDFLNILCDNINKMPKLKTFEFKCKIDDKESNLKKLEEKLKLLNLEKYILSNTFD